MKYVAAIVLSFFLALVLFLIMPPKEVEGLVVSPATLEQCEAEGGCVLTSAFQIKKAVEEKSKKIAGNCMGSI